MSGQFQPGKFGRPQAGFSYKPVENSTRTLRSRNDVCTSVRLRDRGCFFGLRGSFGFGNIAWTNSCAGAAFQIRLTVPYR